MNKKNKIFLFLLVLFATGTLIAQTMVVLYNYNVCPTVTNTFYLGTQARRWKSISTQACSIGTIVLTSGGGGINLSRLINQKIWQGDTLQGKYLMLSYNSTLAYYWRKLYQVGSYTKLEADNGNSYWLMKDTLPPAVGLKSTFDSLIYIRGFTGATGYDTIKVRSIPIDTAKSSVAINPVANAYTFQFTKWLNESTAVINGGVASPMQYIGMIGIKF